MNGRERGGAPSPTSGHWPRRPLSGTAHPEEGRARRGTSRVLLVLGASLTTVAISNAVNHIIDRARARSRGWSSSR